MLCAISGATPTEPVVSTRSGHIFEKRLIVKHIKVTGTCPVTKEELSESDLVDVKTTQATVKPRPPSATSIPGMLQLFQNEWDALMLETFTLKQHVETVRQELAHALYQHDAACRVIARVVRERDEARAALGHTQNNVAVALGRGRQGASAMDTEEEAGISGSVIKKMQSVAKALSKGRKKAIKEAQAQVASTSAIKKYKMQATHPLHSASKPGITALDLHKTEDLVITGGKDGNAIVFNRGTGKIVDTLKGHKKPVSAVAFHPTESLAFTASLDHTATVWHKGDNGKFNAGHSLKAHSAPVVGCTLHPSGDFLVTASEDKSWAFFDVNTGVCKEQVKEPKFEGGYSRVTFHPDGLILGTGTSDSLVRIFGVKDQKNVATFKGHTGKVTGLSFSENGYYLASSDENGVVKLWDLRKLENFHTLKADNLKSISNLTFDSSGSYLAVAGDDVQMYGTKEWDLVKTWDNHKKEVTDVKFGTGASFLASVSLDRNLKFYR
jgi:pre-mRNA-processing factor 19